MPIYEYVCESCRHQFEVRQKFSDDPISACVRCGQAVKKIISAPAIMFKGSGWYVTDYSDKLKAPEQPAANDAAAKPAPSAETNTPATPATGNGAAASSPTQTSGSSQESGTKSSSTATPAPPSQTSPSS